jgi:hypothetical protein
VSGAALATRRSTMNTQHSAGYGAAFKDTSGLGIRMAVKLAIVGLGIR